MRCKIFGKLRFFCEIGKDEVECSLTVEYAPHDGYLELMSFTVCGSAHIEIDNIEIDKMVCPFDKTLKVTWTKII